MERHTMAVKIKENKMNEFRKSLERFGRNWLNGRIKTE